MIRYPVGDLAEWVDVEDGIFRLLGRADEGARVGRGVVAPLAVEWVPVLEVNPRTGKTVWLLDEHPCS